MDGDIPVAEYENIFFKAIAYALHKIEPSTDTTDTNNDATTEPANDTQLNVFKFACDGNKDDEKSSEECINNYILDKVYYYLDDESAIPSYCRQNHAQYINIKNPVTAFEVEGFLNAFYEDTITHKGCENKKHVFFYDFGISYFNTDGNSISSIKTFNGNLITEPEQVEQVAQASSSRIILSRAYCPQNFCDIETDIITNMVSNITIDSLKQSQVPVKGTDEYTKFEGYVIEFLTSKKISIEQDSTRDRDKFNNMIDGMIDFIKSEKIIENIVFDSDSFTENEISNLNIIEVDYSGSGKMKIHLEQKLSVYVHILRMNKENLDVTNKGIGTLLNRISSEIKTEATTISQDIFKDNFSSILRLILSIVGLFVLSIILTFF